jgi:hypothetical protein
VERDNAFAFRKRGVNKEWIEQIVNTQKKKKKKKNGLRVFPHYNQDSRQPGIKLENGFDSGVGIGQCLDEDMVAL